LLGIPRVVGSDNVVVPVLLDQLFEIFAIRGGRIWDVVIGEPSLELSFVPFIVGCSEWIEVSDMLTHGMDKSRRIEVKRQYRAPTRSLIRYIPALVNQLLARTPWVAKATERTVERNRMFSKLFQSFR
jgi:hypothetical protein